MVGHTYHPSHTSLFIVHILNGFMLSSLPCFLFPPILTCWNVYTLVQYIIGSFWNTITFGWMWYKLSILGGGVRVYNFVFYCGKCRIFCVYHLLWVCTRQSLHWAHVLILVHVGKLEVKSSAPFAAITMTSSCALDVMLWQVKADDLNTIAANCSHGHVKWDKIQQ